MINKNYSALKESYLFSTVAKKQREFASENPSLKIYKMSIGDVTLPLSKEVVEAMNKAVAEMGVKETFRGYGDEQGYRFLRESIKEHYRSYNVELDEKEIFVSDGAKSDLGNFTELFSADATVLVPDPVYPVYVDSNMMAGRRIKYIKADKTNSFLPMPSEDDAADIIYLCSPNNPTGAVYDRTQLKAWVDFALAHGSVILFDAAYEFFVGGDLPHSIFEIEGAKECAVEFCSFSKTAGFTGVRCGYAVVPEKLVRDGVSLNKMWLRRQTTKFNGVSYIVQRGAAAVFADGGKGAKETIRYYKENAGIITRALDSLGVFYTGGSNSPYVFFECPAGMDSWDFFDLALKRAQVVGTPGAGFGENGKKFFRLTAFSDRETTMIATERLGNLIADVKKG